MAPHRPSRAPQSHPAQPVTTASGHKNHGSCTYWASQFLPSLKAVNRPPNLGQQLKARSSIRVKITIHMKEIGSTWRVERLELAADGMYQTIDLSLSADSYEQAVATGKQHALAVLREQRQEQAQILWATKPSMPRQRSVREFILGRNNPMTGLAPAAEPPCWLRLHRTP